MEHRAEAEQAEGSTGTAVVTPDEAFEMLDEPSQHKSRKLRDIVIELMEQDSSAEARP